jgi:Na+-driven multidrug efflux pump
VLTGAFYALTYIGFGLPLLLTTVGFSGGHIILAGMATIAASAAIFRTLRLRRDSHRQS